MGDYKVKFVISVEKLPDHWWSFGICLYHTDDKTYIFINLFKWSISIGKLIKWKEIVQEYNTPIQISFVNMKIVIYYIYE